MNSLAFASASATYASLRRWHQQCSLLAVAEHCKPEQLVPLWLAFPDHHNIHRSASLLHVLSIMSVHTVFN